MYEDYFGLERPPFKITPDTSLFYDGGKRGDILEALVYAVHRGEGIIKVVGEVGSGKTMLCRMLQLRLPDTVEIVYIANPSVSAEDSLRCSSGGSLTTSWARANWRTWGGWSVCWWACMRCRN